MIDVKEAVNKAREFMTEVYAGQEELREPRLEEIELSEGEDHWLITISFLRERDPLPQIAAIKAFNPQFERVYKTLRVDADTGDVRQMKMRAAV